MLSKEAAINALPKSQIIKHSLALRAKYRLHQGATPYIQTFHPSLVVPHYGNRAGEPVKSIRTKQLCGIISTDGCDVLDANSIAVAVQDNPTSPKFQKRFEEQISLDNELAKH